MSKKSVGYVFLAIFEIVAIFFAIYFNGLEYIVPVIGVLVISVNNMDACLHCNIFKAPKSLRKWKDTYVVSYFVFLFFMMFGIDCARDNELVLATVFYILYLIDCYIVRIAIKKLYC